MSRRSNTPDPGHPERESDGEGFEARARVRLRRIDVHQMIRTVYSVSAILLWGAATVVSLRLGPGAVGAAVELTQAVTRASVALERATESTARIEATTTQSQAEQREMRREIADRLDRIGASCARCETPRR